MKVLGFYNLKFINNNKTNTTYPNKKKTKNKLSGRPIKPVQMQMR